MSERTHKDRVASHPWSPILALCALLVGCDLGGNSAVQLDVCTTCADSRIESHAIVWPEFPESAKNQLALAASAAHAGMIRMDLGWVALQPQEPPAPYQWHWADESVRAARSHNLEVLALITEIPQWASSAPTDPASRFFPPSDSAWDDWQTFVGAFAARYGAGGTNEIHVWEICGEANLSDQWKGTPAQYARLYSLAYDAIKQADPTATVLMAGMTEHGQPAWLNAVLNDPDYPAKGKIDAIDVHIRGSVANVQTLVANWREAFRLQGLDNLPLWITEFGFPSSPRYQPEWDPQFVGVNPIDGEIKQADYYNTMIPWLLTTGNVHRLFVTLRDLDTPNSGFASEGIFDLTATRPKFAFDAIRSLADNYR